MAAGTIYTVHADGRLVRMRPGAPSTEDQMQALVARYPELIGDADGSLLLIRREQPIGDSADASGRWSLDHLFVTRKAVPVLVELKRATDSRLRREVVGQMLDYAANGVAYWQVGTIARAFAATCEDAGVDPAVQLEEFLESQDFDAFWSQVDANFIAGRVKLVFVADVVPRELARIVEFLNEQMRADVRAVELKWYEDQAGTTTLVPRIIGETERAISQKLAARAVAEPIDMTEWIDKHMLPLGDEAVRGATAYIAMVEELGGKAQVANAQGSIIGVFETQDGSKVYPLHLWRDGKVSITFRYLLKRPGLAAEGTRRAIYDAFTRVVGPLTTTSLAGYPSFRVTVFDVPATLEPLISAARELVAAATTSSQQA